MTPRFANRRSARLTFDLTRSLGAEYRSVREDAGLSQSELSRRSGVDQGAISRFEAGKEMPSPRNLVALADALGGRLSMRLYPVTGPRVRDALQAPVVEALISSAHARWQPVPEVAVYSPVRGVIDLVLVDRLTPTLIAVEVHSTIRRLEQQLRWAAEKADALPSSRVWGELHQPVTIARVLVLRSTRTTRDLARRFPATFAAAYPIPAGEALAALAHGLAWPGDAIIWSDTTSSAARLLPNPPRGVPFGR